MKKIFIISIILFLSCGCQNINKSTYDEIISDAITSDYNLNNVQRSGYKYYVPAGVTLLTNNDYNDTLLIDNTKYYLYIDIISYYNKVENSYEVNSELFYSQKYENESEIGYLQIKLLENEKYFIEIMYNYAKIEVIVDENDIKKAVAYSASILSSVQYNDTIIESLMNDSIHLAGELEYDIFATAEPESNTLEFAEDTTESEEDTSTDTDIIK